MLGRRRRDWPSLAAFARDGTELGSFTTTKESHAPKMEDWRQRTCTCRTFLLSYLSEALSLEQRFRCTAQSRFERDVRLQSPPARLEVYPEAREIRQHLPLKVSSTRRPREVNCCASHLTDEICSCCCGDTWETSRTAAYSSQAMETMATRG